MRSRYLRILLVIWAVAGPVTARALLRPERAVLAGQTEYVPPDAAQRDAYFLTPIGGLPPATDSASAATAIATGTKTDAGNISWAPGDPEGGALQTIAERLRSQHGFAIGVATTVPFDHATPATFVSHNRSRSNYTALGHEIVFETVPEVVIGGGHPDFYLGGVNYTYLSAADYDLLANGQTAYTHFVSRSLGVDGGAALVTAASTVSLAEGHRLFGYFGGAGGNFDYYVVGDTPGVPSVARGSIEDPTLADVVSSTLSILNQDGDGFFALFEQGDIDWSNHANDFAHMVGSIWDLDAAVRAAEGFLDQDDGLSWLNTLVIVTADHSNGYLRLHDALGKGDLPRQSDSTYPDGEISFRTTRHTNELVTLWAKGAGASLFDEYAGEWYAGTRIVDNTRIYDVVHRAVEEREAEHVLLFVGDGMNINNEVAGSRYLYGLDFGLAWHGWWRLSDSWSGFAATWDVNTYEKYASAAGTGLPYSPDAFDPLLGYDPVRGGRTPFPLLWSQDGLWPVRHYLPVVRRSVLLEPSIGSQTAPIQMGVR